MTMGSDLIVSFEQAPMEKWVSRFKHPAEKIVADGEITLPVR